MTRLVVGAGIAGVVLVGAVGCASHSQILDVPDAAEDLEELVVSVADEASEHGPLSEDQVEASGPGHPRVTLVRDNGGVLRTGRGEDGARVLAFPAHEASERSPVAIIAVMSREPDWLQPRGDRLIFGADLSLDAVSDGTAQDNGDNVLQRGLFGAPAQFKLQVDHRRPSCLVRGDAGAVLVKSSVTLEPRSWYRITCRRTGDEVEVVVSHLDHGDPAENSVDEDRDEIGSLVFPSETPLSIGGKLGPDGGPVQDATDQYDGSVARVHVSIQDAGS